MSKNERLILELLQPGVEMYGLDMIAASNGQLKRGTVYLTLARMEQEGSITSRPETDEDPMTLAIQPRRLYKIAKS